MVLLLLVLCCREHHCCSLLLLCRRLLIVLNVDDANPTFPYNQMIGNPQPVPDMPEGNGAPGNGSRCI